MSAAASPPLLRWRSLFGARWRSLAPRERAGVGAAVVALALLLTWTVLIAPAWRTLRESPAEIERLDAQLRQMQRHALEAKELKGTNPVSAAQSAVALKAATDRLGDRARLAVLGDRATLTLNGVSADALRQWLAEARSGARARAVEAQLARGPQGYTGTLIVTLGGAS